MYAVTYADRHSRLPLVLASAGHRLHWFRRIANARVGDVVFSDDFSH